MSLFITFEGPDGSGKSTQAHRLAARLRTRGLPIVETREPGGTALGDRLRTLILDQGSPEATPLAMALLLSASRAQLVADVIRPSLAAGTIVIADRYADSTLAYQAFGLGVDLSVARELVGIATGGLRPDITIYVDVPPQVAYQRMHQRGGHNRLDARPEEFHRRVRQGYQQLISEDPQRWIVIDGANHADSVETAIMRAIEPKLPKVDLRP
ncbi:MAG: dTMP kinase [Chloroflexota bacterium]